MRPKRTKHLANHCTVFQTCFNAFLAADVTIIRVLYLRGRSNAALSYLKLFKAASDLRQDFVDWAELDT